MQRISGPESGLSGDGPESDEDRRRRLAEAMGAATAGVRAEIFRENVMRLTPRAYFTPALIAVNVLVFVVMAAFGVGPLDPESEEMITWGADFGPRTLAGEWWRLVTSTFLHFGIIHILFNMYVLWMIGRLAERILGNPTFLVTYLLAGLAGSLASLAWHPMVVSAGASGAVFGLYGALLAYLARHRESVPMEIVAQQRRGAFIFIAFNIFYGFSRPGIDNAGHIGGLAGGFLVALALSVPLTAEARRSAWKKLVPGTAVFLALAAAACWAMPRGVAHLDEKIMRLEGLEDKAIKAYNGGVTRMQQGEITEAEFAEVLEADVLPAWKEAEELSSGMKGLPSRLQRRVSAFAIHFALWRESTELLIRAIRTGDDALRRKAFAKRHQAEDAMDSPK